MSKKDDWPRGEQKDIGTLPLCIGGGINPIGLFACRSHECRRATAKALARSIGLYADRVIINDFITDTLLHIDELDDVSIYDLYGNVIALSVLEPMIREGVIAFAGTSILYCPDCAAEVKKLVKSATTRIWDTMSPRVRVEDIVYKNGEAHVAYLTGVLNQPADPAMNVITLPEAEGRAIEKGMKQKGRTRHIPIQLRAATISRIEMHIYAALLQESTASHFSGAVASTSRIENAAIRMLRGGRLVSAPQYDNWERVRSVSLPWVSELEVSEVLLLRERARHALPSFRARLNKELFSYSHDGTSPDDQAKRVVAELQLETEELEAELKAIKVRRGRFVDLAIGGLGIGLTVYGVGSHDPTSFYAGSAILASVATRHPARSELHAEMKRLRSSPAQVLLASRDLLKERH